MIKVSKRIEKLAKYTEGFNKLADIGCDHAKLSIYAILNHYVKSGLACDINPNPLLQAKNNIEYYQLNDKITVKEADGLDAIDDVVDVIVLAGMGGMLICELLGKNISKLNNIKRLIIQANKDYEMVRRWLADHQYRISFEEMFVDKTIPYQIIVATKSLEKVIYLEEDYLFGPILRKNQNEAFIYYYQNKVLKLKNTLDEIQNLSEKEKIIYEIKVIENILKINEDDH